MYIAIGFPKHSQYNIRRDFGFKIKHKNTRAFNFENKTTKINIKTTL
jgi:hypothetical protein